MDSDKALYRLLLEDEGKERHITAGFRTLTGEYPLHWHSFFEIELITEGWGWHNLNGEKTRVEAGSAYLLHPTDFHTLCAVEPMRMWNLSFDEEMLSEARLCELSSPSLQKIYTLGSDVTETLCSLAKLLEGEYRRESAGCARELCESFLCILLRQGQRVTAKESYRLSGIRKALLYMDVHFRESPSLTQTAAQAGFHPHYFCEMFRRVTGESYTTRLNSLKTGYAKMLLSKGFSVTEACYRSGFGSMSNFLTVFRRICGCCPEEFKNRSLHNGEKGV